ncbi:response regulator [Candidatus Woesearchaeota archaeon]|nr:response regulator [Candidatus Woesearchaeota archaeon]
MKKTIMVVDDETHIVQLLQIILKEEGYNVIPVHTAKECLELLKTKKPDLLLLDVMMPDMNGKELCKKIREDPKTKDLRIAFLSILRKEEVGTDFFQSMGLKGHITKPFERDELVKKIKEFLAE